MERGFRVCAVDRVDKVDKQSRSVLTAAKEVLSHSVVSRWN